MEHIFITDLDGTLLQSNGFLSVESEEVLNQLALTQHKIAFATARGLTSAQKVIHHIGWNFPVLLNNGAVIYDWQRQKVLKINGIAPQLIQMILELGSAHGLSPLIFTLNEKFEEGIFYQQNPSKGLHYFMGMRPNDPRFVEVENISDALITADTQGLVLMFIDSYEALVPLKLYLQEQAANEVNCLLLKDQYIPDQFVLEISSTTATKEHGIAYLIQEYNLKPEQLHLFGDNLNDQGMLALPANTYAVSNAHPAILAQATHVIPSNDQSGVAQTIQHIISREEKR